MLLKVGGRTRSGVRVSKLWFRPTPLHPRPGNLELPLLSVLSFPTEAGYVRGGFLGGRLLTGTFLLSPFPEGHRPAVRCQHPSLAPCYESN